MVSILVAIDAAFLEPLVKGVLLIRVKSNKKIWTFLNLVYVFCLVASFWFNKMFHFNILSISLEVCICDNLSESIFSQRSGAIHILWFALILA